MITRIETVGNDHVFVVLDCIQSIVIVFRSSTATTPIQMFAGFAGVADRFNELANNFSEFITLTDVLQHMTPTTEIKISK